MMKIKKIAYTNTEEDAIPDIDVMGMFVDVLKMYLLEQAENQTPISKDIDRLIRNLPSEREMKYSYSPQECNLVFETIRYLWKEIMGKDLQDEAKVETSTQAFLGNYWMFRNGLLINGTNHFTCIKENSTLMILLLNLNGMTLQYYMSTDPNKLIRYIIKNGGVRMFVNKNNEAFFQMTEHTYAQWGKEKIKKLELKKKSVQILDLKAKYNGWGSGITILL